MSFVYQESVYRIRPEGIDRCRRRSRGANLQRDLKQIEDSYGGDVLNLVLARGYLVKLLGNPSVRQYLDRHQPDIGRELRGLVDSIASEHTGAPTAEADTVTSS